MGQPVTVIEKPSSVSGVVRFETNRPLTGMGHEIYRVLINENEFYSPIPLSFKRIAEICFHEYSAVVFALEIEIKGKISIDIRVRHRKENR
jgi:hypothetical protein